MLTAGELAAMRAAVEAALPDACTVLRWDPAHYRWDTVAACRCRIVPKRSVTRATSGALEGVTLWHIDLPHATPAAAGDRISCSATIYRITGLDRGRSWPLCLVAQCCTETA